MRIGIIIAALLLSFVLVDDADAIGRRRRRMNRNYYSYNTRGGNASFNATDPQALALEKATYNANRRNFWHPGGGYGIANAEGVGYSTYSAADALGNCCFTGKRAVAGQAVVYANGGWYAVKLFW